MRVPVETLSATKFTFTNAGVASTCSTTGAFRLAEDVLSKGQVDLLFVEFAVNDDQDAGHSRRDCIRGMEGIVRRLWAANPKADVVFLYFVNPSMLKTIQAGRTPLTIASHEEVARHYKISTVDVAKEFADQARSGAMTWERYGGVHPARAGNELCASLIEELFRCAAKAAPDSAATAPIPLLQPPLDPKNYGNGRFIDLHEAVVGKGWTLAAPNWRKIPGAWRERFRDAPMLCADEPGAEATLKFTGTAVGAYIVAGPDAGIIEAAVDDGPLRSFDLFHPYSRGLHYPRTVMFAAELTPGAHTLHWRIASKKNSGSIGNAMRIVDLAAN